MNWARAKRDQGRNGAQMGEGLPQGPGSTILTGPAQKWPELEFVVDGGEGCALRALANHSGLYASPRCQGEASKELRGALLP